MIRTVGTAIAAAALAAGATACDPRAFSDLEDETWVVTSGQPGGMDADDYVVAITFAGTTTTDGSRLIVMGDLPASVGAIRYQPNGSSDSQGKRITDLATVNETTSFDNRRPLAAYRDVIGSDGAIAIGLPQEGMGGDSGMVLIVDLSTFETHRPLNPVPGLVDQGAALAFATTDFEDGADSQVDLIASATNNIVMHPDVLTSPIVPAVNCPVGRERVYSIVGADVLGGDTGDEILMMRGDITLDGSATASDIVITTGGNIVAASEDVTTNDCFDPVAVPPRAPLATIAAPNGEIDFGLHMVAGDFDGNGMTDLAASAPSANVVYVFLDVDAGTVDAPDITVAGSGAAEFGAALAAGDLDGAAGDELAVGAPETTVDGTASAGSVFVYALNGAGDGFDLVNQLHDSDPEIGQRVGRAIAIAPFGNSGGILGVGAAGELFTYFRTSADFPDVRE